MSNVVFPELPVIQSLNDVTTDGINAFTNNTSYGHETSYIGCGNRTGVYVCLTQGWEVNRFDYCIITVGKFSTNPARIYLAATRNPAWQYNAQSDSYQYTDPNTGISITLQTGLSSGVYKGPLVSSNIPFYNYPESQARPLIVADFFKFLNGSDPYESGGFSTEGGGTGNFDGTSDTISIPGMPTINGLNTGFFTAFTPTQAQLQSVSQYLWTNVISDILDINTGLKEKLDALKTIVANPYDAIMGCSLIPVTPTSGGSKELKMYGVVETGITLPYASSRWVDVDCGTLNVNEYWGGYLDYAPYTKTTSLYLPYIGTVSIDVDLIMGKALQIYYRVDILSGNCVAYILIDGSVKFSYHGNCAISIPITSSDYSGAIQSGLGLVGSVANIAAATGGLGAAAGAALKGAASAAISSAPSIASNVMGMKPDIKSGGSIGGASGFLGVQKPYLIIERPKQSLPQDQFKFTGYPLNMTMSVGDCKGYTEFDMILLDGLSLTDTEKNELENIMRKGVYL